MNAAKKAVKSQSKAVKIDTVLGHCFMGTLQSFDRFFLTESYLHSYFFCNIPLQFSLVTFLKGFCLINQEGFGCLFFKDGSGNFL